MGTWRQAARSAFVHHQNEPGYTTNYPACSWTAPLFAKSLVAVVHNPGSSAKGTTVVIGGKQLQLRVPGNGFATVNPQ